MKKYYIAILMLSIVFVSCKKDDAGNGGGPEPTVNQKYVFSYWLSDYTQYIWAVDSIQNLMKGEISMQGIGIEQSGDCLPVANTFFAAHSGDEGAVSYALTNTGQIAPKGKVALESIYAIGHTDDQKAILIGASWEGASTNIQISIYDPASASVTKKTLVDVSMINGTDTLFYWPDGATATGGYLYIPSFLRFKDWNIRHTDTAYLRVYSYPGLEYVATLKDARTAPIGMYYTNTGIIQTDGGDVYTFSSSAYAAGYTPAGKPSGILRIKKGQHEFDKDYFFDMEASSLKGKVISAYYVGGNKAVVKYIPATLDNADNAWAFLNNTKMIFKSAIVDLENKTVTPITGIADHAGDEYYGLNSLYYENGMAYKSYLTNTEARVYGIDLATGAATKGALLKGGLYLPVIGKLTY